MDPTQLMPIIGILFFMVFTWYQGIGTDVSSNEFTTAAAAAAEKDKKPEGKDKKKGKGGKGGNMGADIVIDDRPGKEFINFNATPSVIKNIEKNEDDCYPLKVSKIEKINHDSYLY